MERENNSFREREISKSSDEALRGKIRVGSWVRFSRPGQGGSREGEVVGWDSPDGVNHCPCVKLKGEAREITLNKDYVVYGVDEPEPFLKRKEVAGEKPKESSKLPEREKEEEKAEEEREAA